MAQIEQLNITALCVTYNRPALLGRSIFCFEQQQYANGHLYILDDGAQYESHSGPNWVLESEHERYPDLSAKRNAAAESALELWPDTDVIMTWDDDDVYFPHALSSVNAALTNAHYQGVRRHGSQPHAGSTSSTATTVRASFAA